MSVDLALPCAPKDCDAAFASATKFVEKKLEILTRRELKAAQVQNEQASDDPDDYDVLGD